MNNITTLLVIVGALMSSDRINGTLESHQKYQIAPPTVIVLLIGCLSGTILILLIIIGVCLVRGSPGYGKAKKSKENTHSPHNNREGKLLFQCNIITWQRFHRYVEYWQLFCQFQFKCKFSNYLE